MRAISVAVLILGNVLRNSVGIKCRLSRSLQAQTRRFPSRTTHWPFYCTTMMRSPANSPVFAILRAKSCTSS